MYTVPSQGSHKPHETVQLLVDIGAIEDSTGDTLDQYLKLIEFHLGEVLSEFKFFSILTVNFTTCSSMVDYTILTLVPRQDTIH